MRDALPAASYPYLSCVHRAILNLPGCSTENNLAIELQNAIRSIGFGFYHYSGILRIDSNNHTNHTLSNLPTSWKERHFGADSTYDPILQLAHHRLTPVILEWSKEDSGDSACAHDALKIDNVGTGVIFPIHAKNGDSAVLGLFMHAGQNGATEPGDLPLGEVSLIATCLHDAIIRVTSNTGPIPKAPLTRREIECLQLIANYKSNWVISRIFGTSEHAVVYYVRRLMWKLDAQNRHQAVERAAACGLI